MAGRNDRASRAARTRRGPAPAAGRRAGDDAAPARPGPFAAVYAVVRQVPRGRVVTYGQISALLGGVISPAAVGWALHGCPAGVPWQRVVNARGGLSTERLPDGPPGLQRALLEAEGVEFRADGTLDLARFRHEPASPTIEPRRGKAPDARKGTTR